jgi:hypothetical protein
MKERCVVTPTTVSGLTQTLPLFSEAKSSPPPQADKGTASESAVAPSANSGASIFSADTVSISSQSRQAASEVKKEVLPLEVVKEEKVKEEKAKKEGASVLVNGDNPERALSKIQFVYDLKGELSVKYMDASDRLIYQTPSELMLYLKEAALKTVSSVDMKA